MRIGLISDTHIPEAGPDIPRQVFDVFDGVDLILHAGDTHVIEVLDWLEAIAPVFGARGNGDVPHLSNKNRPGLPDDPRVKDARVLEIEQLKVGLIHGFPLPEEVPWRTMDELLNMYFDGPVDVVVCGDTHEARIDYRFGVLIVNPGSPTLPNQMSKLGHVGLLDIDGASPRANIIQLK